MPLTHKDFIENDIMQILALLPEDADAADRMALTARWQKARLKEFGWVGDFVSGDPSMPYGLNIHTHGLRESFDHYDIQIVAQLPPDLFNQLLSNAVDRIKDGIVFVPGIEYDGLIGGGYKVCFVVATEGNREVLRMILPGKDGKLRESEIDPMFKDQYQNTRMNFECSA